MSASSRGRRSRDPPMAVPVGGDAPPGEPDRLHAHSRGDGPLLPGVETPKAADVKNWADVLSNVITPGDSNKEHRAYLKALAQKTWDLVSWLTHYADATGYHAQGRAQGSRAHPPQLVLRGHGPWERWAGPVRHLPVVSFARGLRAGGRLRRAGGPDLRQVRLASGWHLHRER